MPPNQRTKALFHASSGSNVPLSPPSHFMEGITSSVSSGCGLPGHSPGWNPNRGPALVLGPPRSPPARGQAVPDPKFTYYRRSMAWFCIQQTLVFANSELWLQLSIWVLVVSQYNIYINSAVSDILSPPFLHFAIWSIFVESLRNMPNFRRDFAATQGILLTLQIGDREVKEYPKLHTLHMENFVIQ